MQEAAVDGEQRARTAAAAEAVSRLAPGMTIGLGSGRAVARVIQAIAERWPQRPPLRAVCASTATEAHARTAGIERVELDGTFRLDLAIDGADEVDARLGLIKGGGGALLREKLVVEAADRFIVVAETPKRVQRLGERHALPVEIVRFAWHETRARLVALLPDAVLRTTHGGGPFVTDEGHYLLDCAVPRDRDLHALAHDIKERLGVVDHGFFLDLADEALLGTYDGQVEIVKRA